jgi:hypothetical protein
MANKRIKDLPIVTTWADTDVIAIDNGSTRSIEKQDLGFAKDDLSNVTQQNIADKGIAKDDFSNVDLELRIPEATETVRGTVSRATTTEGGLGVDTTKYISPKVLNDVLTATGVAGGILPRKFISGLVPSYISSSIIEISDGVCRDQSNSFNMGLSSTFRKTLDQNWTAGQGNLGLARNREITGFYATTGTTVTGTGTLFVSEVKVGDVIYSSSNTESRRITQTDFAMTGTITTNLTNVVGVGTLFTTETAVGEYLLVNGEPRKIQNIVNDTSLVLETAFSVDYTIGVSFERKSDTEVIIDTAFTAPVANDRMTLGGKYKGSTYHLFLLTDGLGNIDAGYDFDVNATNLLADSSVVSAGLNRYRRIGSFLLDDSAEIPQFDSFELDGSGIQLRTTEQTTGDITHSGGLDIYVGMPEGVLLKGHFFFTRDNISASFQSVRTAKDINSISKYIVYENTSSSEWTGEEFTEYSDTGFIYVITSASLSGVCKIINDGYTDYRR